MTVAGVAFARLDRRHRHRRDDLQPARHGHGSSIDAHHRAKDIRVVQSAVLVIAVFYVLINLVVDVSYSYLDPRIRRGRL